MATQYPKIGQYPSQSLQPGMTGDAVKQLQDFLVQQGYMTQAQVSTGYGIYGPQTTAAVAKLQNALGVDNSSGVGYWGPKTLAAVENVPFNDVPSTQKWASGGTSSKSGSNTQLANNNTPQGQNQQQITPDMVQALQFLGFTQDQINAMNPSDAANWSMIGTYMKKQSDLSTLQGQISAQTFNDAYQKALQDPNIVGKYADLAKINASDFSNTLGQISLNAQITGQQQGIQMTNEQKALKEQEAAAGRAYSGFRQQAQQQLDTTQQGIIQSTRSQIQQQLRQAQAGIEQQYGSQYLSTLPQAQAQYINPLTGQAENITAQPYGSIATLPGQQSQIQQQQNQDVLNRQQAIYNVEMPPVVPPTYSPTAKY